MKKILYIYNTNTSWTRRDLSILRQSYQVDDRMIRSIGDVIGLLNPFRILKYDLCFFWFASLQFLPILLVAKAMGRKIVVVAGGYDVVNLPEISYGAFTQSTGAIMLRRILFNAATMVISISKSNQREAFENAGVPIQKSKMIYHGFEKNEMDLRRWDERKKQLITVGEFNEETYLRKGHKYFIQLASEMPEWEFVLIGKIDEVYFETLNLKVPDNLRMTGFIDQTEYDTLLNLSKYYLQLSWHEGFGCSVIEATLLGCYPIVFDSYALPEVIEGMGQVISLEDIQSVKAFIESDSQEHDSEELRIFFQEKFSFEQRSKKLLHAVSSLF